MLVADFSLASGDNKMLKYNASLCNDPNNYKLKILSPQSSLSILHRFVKRFYLRNSRTNLQHKF